jgi:leader peptidase (prepilin peptidase)/N-methyltransferase
MYACPGCENPHPIAKKKLAKKKPMSLALILCMAFIFGACIGSFLNVCISRLPAAESIIYPSSRCPGCRSAIRFYDNIPVLSYLWLRGRCRSCGWPIPLRYLMVEVITGGMAVCMLYRFGLTADALTYFVLAAALILVIFIDLDHQLIPDIISLPGILIGFFSSFWLSDLSYLDSLIGLFLGGGLLFAVAAGYYFITGKEGMGGGDIKLLAMIGAFLGWQGVCFTIFVASITGTIAGLLLVALAQKDLKFALPFGPFLSIGAISYLFFGPRVIAFYFSGAPLF